MTGPAGDAAAHHAVERALAGDRDAFADLYRIYSGPLLSFLATQVRRVEDAEDLVGQVFLEAMRGIGRFTGDAAGFRAWLFRIGRDRAVDLGRSLTRRPDAPLEAAADLAAPIGTEEQALAALDRARVWDAVRSLPGAQREVIALRLAGGLTSAEVAAIVGKEPNAVKALQHRALANLGRLLGKQTPQSGASAAAPGTGGVPAGPPPSLEE